MQAYPDVGILVVLGEVQHIVQSQHSGRGLGEIHGGVDMILGMKIKGSMKLVLQQTSPIPRD